MIYNYSMYEYKFIKFNANTKAEKVEKELNDLGSQGWKIVNFHPSSDRETGRDIREHFKQSVGIDNTYVFLLMRESHQ